MNNENFDIMKRKLDDIEKEYEEDEERIAEHERKVKRLRKIVNVIKEFSDNQPAQRTKEWFDLRKNIITASDIGSCLVKCSKNVDPYINEYNLQGKFEKSYLTYCNPYSNLDDFILKKKGYTKFTGNKFTEWGNTYETAGLRFYELFTNQKILDFNLLFHKNIKWLGASPDGITEDGRMLEIKCPFSRKINGIPPLVYWIQMQIQLEVTDLEECDYLECQISEIKKEDFEVINNPISFFNSDGKIEIKEVQNKGLYIHMKDMNLFPSKEIVDRDKIIEWAQKKIKKYAKLFPVIKYYSIDRCTLITIKRNRQWFKDILPELEEVKQKLDNFKVEDYKDKIKNKEKRVEYACEKVECVFDDNDDNDYLIDKKEE